MMESVESAESVGFIYIINNVARIILSFLTGINMLTERGLLMYTEL